ncbi:MAG: glutamate--tRNA ligase, partial [Acidiferrobacteraceae bacterium]
TPRQINMLRALGVDPPVYAHVPMIMGADGARLSKRHGAVSVTQYRDDGFLPDALLNYLIRLGWSHGDQEIFSRDEMIALFDVSKVHGSPASFNPEKLLWLNQHYIKQTDAAVLAPRFEALLRSRGLDPTHGPAVSAVIEAQRERAKTLAEMAENSRLFFQDGVDLDADAAAKYLVPAVRAPLDGLRMAFEALNDWSAEAIHRKIEEVGRQSGLSFGKIAQPLRVAVAGRPVSPPIDVTLALIGKAHVLRRIDAALSYLRDAEAQQGRAS